MNTSRRGFARALIGALPVSRLLATTEESRWREQRKRFAHRRRRLIYGDDGDERLYPAPAKDAAEFLARRFDWTKQTQVDSYFWCAGDGQDPPWGLNDPRGVGDSTRVMLDAARAAGQEAVVSVRMNDIHDAFGKMTYPFKLQHRDLLLDPGGARGKYPMTDWRYWYWSAMDYASPAVRRHKFAYIAEISEKYLPDGVELDFMRHPRFFKPGEEATNLATMTEFVRKIRIRLDDIGRGRGRPLLLAARLADTPELSVKLGLDGPTWLREGLLDVLIIGTGFAPYDGSWKEFAAMARQHEVTAYPAYDCALLAHMPQVELLRGAAMNYWTEGAQGIYLFNPFVPPDLKKLSPEVMYGEFRCLGDAATLHGLDKAYCTNYLSPSVDPNQFVWTYGATADRPLPAKISRQPRTFSVLAAENLAAVPAGRKCTLRLRLLTDKPERAARLVARLNGKTLENGERAGDGKLEFQVALSGVRKGTNDIEVEYPEGEAVLKLIELWVLYT